jgi:hypothetical protein
MGSNVARARNEAMSLPGYIFREASEDAVRLPADDGEYARSDGSTRSRRLFPGLLPIPRLEFLAHDMLSIVAGVP